MTRARCSLVALLLTALMVAVPAGAASAHDQLTGSTPEDGSTVEAPDELVLTFSGRIGDLGAQIAVTGPDGQSVVDGTPEVDGTEVEQQLVDDLEPGDYEVIWRVTSEDGHPISGELGFTVEGVADDGATTEATADATEPTEETTAPPTEATDEATDDADVTADPAETEGAGGLPVWAWVVVVLAAVGLLGLLGRTWARGRE